jgi:hypothetical protein
VIVVALLALGTGVLGLMVQAALASRREIARLDARIRTVVELREAGAFGTGGFGGDKPVGGADFSVDTLERLQRIPNAARRFRLTPEMSAPILRPDGSARWPPAGG